MIFSVLLLCANLISCAISPDMVAVGVSGRHPLLACTIVHFSCLRAVTYIGLVQADPLSVSISMYSNMYAFWPDGNEFYAAESALDG